MKPQNFAESLIWYFTLSTYGFYCLGILYPATALLGWILLLYLSIKIWQQTFDNSNHHHHHHKIQIPWLSWFWCLCMLVMLFAMYAGVTEANIDSNYYLRGILGWLTSSSLLAIFILVGSLDIRLELIYRAICILCLQSLIIIPICYLAYYSGLPGIIYSSPVERFIQNGAIFYDVVVHAVDYGTTNVRLTLFAPWCPALGLVSNIYFFLALEESNKKWRFIGIVGAIAMNIVSVSRAALLWLPIVLICVWLVNNFARPVTLIGAGIISSISALLSTPIFNLATNSVAAIKDSRADSSRVRGMLNEIALLRWKESPIWGHGIQEPSGQVVAKLPIGSHHTWLGLLFVRGLVGFVSLAIPMLCSFIYLIIQSSKSANARVALSVLLVIFLFTFSEQIDVLAYICWPGLIVMGKAFTEKI
ncbi:MAG: O-antigen ligase domain-containing protein [Calothrix sp. SM1_7_51]|nr:O-antigen ligase domain-containing protein [Calothrix sp. SM1_7_51]